LLGADERWSKTTTEGQHHYNQHFGLLACKQNSLDRKATHKEEQETSQEEKTVGGMQRLIFGA